MYAGIEAGGTKFVVGVGSGPRDLRVAPSFPTTTPDATLALAVATVRELSDGAPPSAVGVASFGPLDLDPRSPGYGTITSTPKPGWRDTDLLSPLRAAFDVPVGLDTDVNAAALAEWRWGASRGTDASVYITVGTGIGGGAIVAGRLLHGLVHPEMGHLPVRRHADDRFAGGCPFHGDCLEGLAAGPAIEGRFGRPGAELGQQREQAVELEAWYLGQLAAAATYLLSPRRIVMGGGVLHLPGLIEAVARRTVALLAGYIDHPAITARPHEYVVLPGLGDRSGVLGALALAQAAESGEGWGVRVDGAAAGR